MTIKLYVLFVISHYNHLPMFLVNFEISQADLKRMRITQLLWKLDIYTSNLTLITGYNHAH